MSEGWFCFERAGKPQRPASFQSPELDNLFLENPDVPLGAVWCVSSPGLRLIYFWGDRTQFNVSSNESGRFGYCSRRFKPFFDQFISGSGALLAPEILSAATSDPIKYVTLCEIGKNPIEIYAGKGFIYFYQMKSSRNSDINTRTFLLDRSERGYDLCRQAHHFFERVPKGLLKMDLGAEKIFQQYFSPNCFDLLAEPAVPFAWPWQKSLEIRNGSTSPKEIPTISLVMDIRNSSSAMLLTPDPPRFAMFVDAVIEGARDAITKNGGYFDKETGDGVVGHFEGPRDFQSDGVPLNNALTAAKTISTNTTRLCAEYQTNLSLKLGGLGCAIGMFAGQAVWLYSWRGVRAIGGSVVNASRICKNALPGEVGYCNTISQLIRSIAVKTEVFPLDGAARLIKVSEVRDEARPEANFVKIG